MSVSREQLYRALGNDPELVQAIEILLENAGLIQPASDATGSIQEATVLTLSANDIFTNERILTAGAGVSFDDDGTLLTVNASGEGAISVEGGTLSFTLTGDTDLILPQSGQVITAGYVSASFQPLDATLTAIAGLTTAADQIIYWTGADTAATTTLSAFGRTLIDDADAATARTTIGAEPIIAAGTTGQYWRGDKTWQTLGSMGLQNSNAVSITGGTIDLTGADIKRATTSRANDFTLTSAQASTHQRWTSGSRTCTIPPNASDPIPVGSWAILVNDTAAGTQTVARGAGVSLSYLGADANRTIAAGGWMYIEKIATDSWYGFGVGVT